MTETEWLVCVDPEPMLGFLEGRPSDRKLRLFGSACCRRKWVCLPTEFQLAVETAEQFADGQTTRKRLSAVKSESGTALAALVQPPAVYSACGAAWSTTRNAETAANYPLWVFTDENDRHAHSSILRDLFGNPFRPVVIVPRWLTSTAVALADAIYTDRAFDRLPILADALEDAGCADADLLAHCRGSGPHVRGCWVVDAVLGKT